MNVWSYPEWVRYLCAVVRRLTPRPTTTARRLLYLLDKAVAEGPCDLAEHKRTPTSRDTRRRGAHAVANLACDIVKVWWAESLGVPLDPKWFPRCRDRSGICVEPGEHFEAAKNFARQAEDHAQEAGLTIDDLRECAVSAFAGADRLDNDHRDAAVAAMTADHPEVAFDIIVRGIKEPS